MEALALAAAESRSVAEVLRRLGVRWSGGSHAHISRRLKAAGIDTSHFTGRPTSPRWPGRSRLTPEEILIVRSAHGRRARPELLRRALVEAGTAYRCDLCGVGDTWNGQRLVLQVDHIDGNPTDCRPANLRFLCPNCHSQTGTYAGRNRRTFARSVTAPAETATVATSADDVLAIIGRVDRGQLTVSAAARLIGCSRNQYYRIRQRLQETGSVVPRTAAQARYALDRRRAILAAALASPELGPKVIARRLQEPAGGGWRVSHGTVSNVLGAAGLGTRAARRAAAAEASPPRPG